MRAKSPMLASILGLALSTAVAAADPVVIRIHGDDGATMREAAIVHADVPAVAGAAATAAATRLPEGWIGAARALDAARKAGLEEGVAPWRAVLQYSAAHGAVVWRVSNTTSSVTGNHAGRTFLVHGRDATVLSRERWHAIIG